MSSWGDFRGLWTLKLHSTFCASAVGTLFREYLLDSQRGVWQKGKEHQMKKKEIGIVPCYFLVLISCWEWGMVKSAWNRSSLHTVCVSSPTCPSSPHPTTPPWLGSFLVPTRTSSYHHPIHSRKLSLLTEFLLLQITQNCLSLCLH